MPPRPRLNRRRSSTGSGYPASTTSTYEPYAPTRTVAGARLRAALTGRRAYLAGFPGFHPGLVELALQAGIARKGTEPGEALYWSDGTRPSAVACGWQHCGRLSAFFRIPRLKSAGLLRARSTFTVVLTKALESFKPALRRYQVDCELLKALSESGGH
jgi:hypothetical protein